MILQSPHHSESLTGVLQSMSSVGSSLPITTSEGARLCVSMELLLLHSPLLRSILASVCVSRTDVTILVPGVSLTSLLALDSLLSRGVSSSGLCTEVKEVASMIGINMEGLVTERTHTEGSSSKVISVEVYGGEERTIGNFLKAEPLEPEPAIEDIPGTEETSEGGVWDGREYIACLSGLEDKTLASSNTNAAISNSGTANINAFTASGRDISASSTSGTSSSNTGTDNINASITNGYAWRSGNAGSTSINTKTTSNDNGSAWTNIETVSSNDGIGSINNAIESGYVETGNVNNVVGSEESNNTGTRKSNISKESNNTEIGRSNIEVGKSNTPINSHNKETGSCNAVTKTSNTGAGSSNDGLVNINTKTVNNDAETVSNKTGMESMNAGMLSNNAETADSNTKIISSNTRRVSSNTETMRYKTETGSSKFEIGSSNSGIETSNSGKESSNPTALSNNTLAVNNKIGGISNNTGTESSNARAVSSKVETAWTNAGIGSANVGVLWSNAVAVKSNIGTVARSNTGTSSNHTLGRNTKMKEMNSQAGGRNSYVDGKNSQTDGKNSQVDGNNLKTEGSNLQVDRRNSQTDVRNSQAVGRNSMADRRNLLTDGRNLQLDLSNLQTDRRDSQVHARNSQMDGINLQSYTRISRVDGYKSLWADSSNQGEMKPGVSDSIDEKVKYQTGVSSGQLGDSNIQHSNGSKTGASAPQSGEIGHNSENTSEVKDTTNYSEVRDRNITRNNESRVAHREARDDIQTERSHLKIGMGGFHKIMSDIQSRKDSSGQPRNMKRGDSEVDSNDRQPQAGRKSKISEPTDVKNLNLDSSSQVNGKCSLAADTVLPKISNTMYRNSNVVTGASNVNSEGAHVIKNDSTPRTGASITMPSVSNDKVRSLDIKTEGSHTVKKGVDGNKVQTGDSNILAGGSTASNQHKGNVSNVRKGAIGDRALYSNGQPAIINARSEVRREQNNVEDVLKKNNTVGTGGETSRTESFKLELDRSKNPGNLDRGGTQVCESISKEFLTSESRIGVHETIPGAIRKRKSDNEAINEGVPEKRMDMKSNEKDVSNGDTAIKRIMLAERALKNLDVEFTQSKVRRNFPVASSLKPPSNNSNYISPKLPPVAPVVTTKPQKNDTEIVPVDVIQRKLQTKSLPHASFATGNLQDTSMTAPPTSVSSMLPYQEVKESPQTPSRSTNQIRKLLSVPNLNPQSVLPPISDSMMQSPSRSRKISRREQKATLSEQITAEFKEKTSSCNYSLECEVCKVESKTLSQLLNHYCSHFLTELGVVNKSVTDGLRCTICGQIFKVKHSLNVHLGCKHGKINDILRTKGFKVLPCPVNPTSANLQRNLEIIKQERLESSEDPDFPLLDTLDAVELEEEFFTPDVKTETV